ncbi:opsin family protein [Sporobolomyces koalae]|uniref:opsin family protein n=1 Tax=Sporobolomyces koalae TaxID=500713 RepID=UPI00316FD34C
MLDSVTTPITGGGYYGPVANIDITSHKFLWVVMVIMGVSSVGLYLLGLRRPVGQRAFHELAAAITFTACMSYFAMASDYGSYPVPVEYIRGGSLGKKWVKAGVLHPTRSVWYARYIDWTFTTPLLLLELALATGLPLPKIFNLIFLDIAMIVTGLIGALVPTGYKWVWFGFGCFALVGIWWILLVHARASVSSLGSEYSKAFTTSAVILSGLWLLYPIAWGLADGANAITPNSEMYFYGVLDVLAKPVYCFVHVLAIEKLDWSRLGWTSGKRSDGASLLGGNRDANYGSTDNAGRS